MLTGCPYRNTRTWPEHQRLVMVQDDPAAEIDPDVDSGSRPRRRFWRMDHGRDAGRVRHGAEVNECCWLFGIGRVPAGGDRLRPPNMEAGCHTISFHASHAPEAKEGDKVFHTTKPTLPWRRHDLAGRRLSWKAAHPKARDFLATEATMQAIR
jgi:hypothetical protein